MGRRMAIWELRPGMANDFAMIVPRDEADVLSRRFRVDGFEKDWGSRPPVKAATDPRKKVQPPVADIALMHPGALVLSQAARAALGGFLSRFGQLLELECGGNVLYYYNVTNLVDCVDPEASMRSSAGAIRQEVFRDNSEPAEPAVFKDPLTAKTKIYVNDAAKQLLEEWGTNAGLTGLEITAASSHRRSSE